MNTRRLCQCAGMWISTQTCANDKMCECGCPHLLPWEETSAAGCQRPPVRVRPAAADWLACRTDPLSAGAEAAAEEICMRRNSCLIRQTFGPPSEMLWVCPACTNERRVCWTGNLLCMLEVTDWQGFHAAESLKNNVEMVSNVAEMSNISWKHNSWDREKIYTWQLCKILQINNNVSKHSAHSVITFTTSNRRFGTKFCPCVNAQRMNPTDPLRKICDNSDDLLTFHLSLSCTLISKANISMLAHWTEV